MQQNTSLSAERNISLEKIQNNYQHRYLVMTHDGFENIEL